MKRMTFLAFLLLPLAGASLSSAVARPQTEDVQQAWEEKYDKLNVRHSGKMLSDTSPDFLKVSDDYADIRDFEVAKTPPVIDFAIVTDLRPEYLPYGLARRTGGGWGGWGDVTLLHPRHRLPVRPGRACCAI